MLLLIDNYDSFTYNLFQYFSEFGINVLIKRNDEITLSEIEVLNPMYLVLSPGPCTPDKSGISLDLVSFFSGKIPILGVCLGHQTIAQSFGASLIKLKKVMHGKLSCIHHDKWSIFNGLKNPISMVRYHSWIVDLDTLPSDFEVSAWSLSDGEKQIMGIRHKKFPIEGIQFHPESFLSEGGKVLLKNFLTFYGKLT